MNVTNDYIEKIFFIQIKTITRGEKNERVWNI